jgi:hypothetical protein
LFLLLIQLAFGFKNKHTANDNTSGVITLTRFLESLTPEQRKKVCVVYFDNEEKGLFGSFAFSRLHKTVAKNTLCINIDCVGEGKEALTLANRHARKDPSYNALIEALTEKSSEYDGNYMALKMKPAMFPSDQVNFQKGVGVCCLRKTFIGRLLIRLHTPFDTVCREENIMFFVKGLNEFTNKV